MNFFGRDVYCRINSKDPEIANEAEDGWYYSLNLYKEKTLKIVLSHPSPNFILPLTKLFLHDFSVLSRKVNGEWYDINLKSESEKLSILQFHLLSPISFNYPTKEEPYFNKEYECWLYEELSTTPQGDLNYEIFFSSGIEISFSFDNYKYTQL